MQSQLILNEPIANGLDIIGDRWTLLILREAFYGHSRFEEFHQQTGASRSTLTRRLSSLIENQILYKQPYNDSGKRFEYKFTEKGLSLLGASLLAARWEFDWHIEGQQDISKHLFHKVCGKHMRPEAVCRKCKQSIVYEQVEWQDLSERLDSQLEEIRACNSKRRKRANAVDTDTSDTNLASLIGDRWSLLILIAAFFGTRKYDDFSRQLNTPPSILSERLKHLIAADILSRNAYQDNPPRHDYTLTKKGKALFPFVMTLRQWVIENIETRQTPPRLIHKACGAPLVIDITCGECQQKPWPADLRFNR